MRGGFILGRESGGNMTWRGFIVGEIFRILKKSIQNCKVLFAYIIWTLNLTLTQFYKFTDTKLLEKNLLFQANRPKFKSEFHLCVCHAGGQVGGWQKI